MKVDPDWFGGRLRELREAAELPQHELARRAGLTTDGVAKLERGERKPAWETVLALAEALGVGVVEFTKEPSERSPTGRGRPRKAEPEVPKPKRPRGRPKKQS